MRHSAIQTEDETSGEAVSPGRSRVRMKQSLRSSSFSGRDSENRILGLDNWKADLGDSLDEMLSSGLIAQDKELARILDEVDQISSSTGGEAPDTRALGDVLRRAVLCAVRQSLMERELRSLALTDDLTCLYNRRAFLALASQQMRVARRKSQGLLLFYADVDNLKEINDSFGHREGDLALVRAADALEHTFRNSDIVARIGGDEFAVLALEASYQNRDVILRRLEKSVAKAGAAESRYPLSLSVGMTRFDPKQPVSLGKFLSMADEDMYAEKKQRIRRRSVTN